MSQASALDAPLGTYFSVRCPQRCGARFAGSFGQAGVNLVTIRLLDHINRAHPRAWARHCSMISAPDFSKHDPLSSAP